MKNIHKEVLAKLYKVPVRSDIKWDDVVKLFESLGADIIQGSGSRIRIIYEDSPLFLHKPHPGNWLKKYMVKKVQEFLQEKGIQP